MNKLFPIMMVLAFATTIFAQEGPMSFTFDTPNPQSRSNEYVCDQDAVFSQVYPDGNVGYFSDELSSYTTMDDYTASNPFTGIRFWGMNWPDCPPGATESFIIRFFERNLVNPSIPGTEVHSFSVTGTTIDLGNLYSTYTVYQIDINFNTTVSLLDGWVSISRQNPNDGCLFGWLGNEDGSGNAVVYNSFQDIWDIQTVNMMFCLGSTTTPVPISDWAIYFGILLIGTFIVVRYKVVST